MSLLGVPATIWAGPTVPVPLPAALTQAVHQIQVQTSDSSPSGCSISLNVGRKGWLGLPMYDFTEHLAQLNQGNRIQIRVKVGVVPEPIFDGLITEQEYSFGSEAGTSTLTLRCRDLTARLDLETKEHSFENLDETGIVDDILQGYRDVIPGPNVLIPPLAPNPTVEVEGGRRYVATDLAVINNLGRAHNYVFLIEPGQLGSAAYWGPKKKVTAPQKAISINMGPFTNATGFSVTGSENVGTTVTGTIRDPDTGLDVPVVTSPVSPIPGNAAMPAAARSPDLVRTELVEEGGRPAAAALAQEQARADSVADGAMRATGTLDVARFGDILRPFQTVGVRGVGHHDGNWYVERVSHQLQPGSYVQNFTLSRSGDFPLFPLVAV